MPHQSFQSCLQACDECAIACDHCAASCLKEADVKMMARCIALDMDCAQACRLASAFMSRGSDNASLICEACADICETCGEECSRHQMEHCQQCARACKRCAEECRRMAGAQGRSARPGHRAGASAH